MSVSPSVNQLVRYDDVRGCTAVLARHTERREVSAVTWRTPVSQWLSEREDTQQDHVRQCHPQQLTWLKMGRRKQIVPKKSDNLEDQNSSKATQNDEGWHLLTNKLPSFCLRHLLLNMSNYNSLPLYLDKSLGQCQSFGCVELEMSENIWTNCLSDWQIWLSKRRSSELADISFDWWAFSRSGLVLFQLSYQLCNLIIFSAKIMSIPPLSPRWVSMHLPR